MLCTMNRRKLNADAYFYRRAMDQASQTEYLNAVKCLMNAPAKGKAYFPAVKSRFDDFAAMHINGTQGGSLHPCASRVCTGQ